MVCFRIEWELGFWISNSSPRYLATQSSFFQKTCSVYFCVLCFFSRWSLCWFFWWLILFCFNVVNAWISSFCTEEHQDICREFFSNLRIRNWSLYLFVVKIERIGFCIFSTSIFQSHSLFCWFVLFSDFLLFTV